MIDRVSAGGEGEGGTPSARWDESTVRERLERLSLNGWGFESHGLLDRACERALDDHTRSSTTGRGRMAERARRTTSGETLINRRLA